MSSLLPQRFTALRGRVTSGAFGKGSKSEREAVFIDTVDARYVLRRKAGPVFGDGELTRYLGREIECDGFLVDGTLLAERIVVME